ncbi:MAG: cytochrome c-type biogenesis protein CcmH [Caulobacterales bacterium]|nr:cytochrome c-type biogenesis protein CcmH [Caulobacterales bacterium]
MAAAFAALAGPAAAVNPDEQLRDPRLEARAHELSRTLRCVVCQNQSIDDSDAALAHDLRVILRERIAAGDTDRQAVDYIVARYGSFVELKPPVQGDTLILWFGPLALTLLGGAGIALHLRRRARLAAEPFTADEEAELAHLLNSDAPKTGTLKSGGPA